MMWRLNSNTGCGRSRRCAGTLSSSGSRPTQTSELFFRAAAYSFAMNAPCFAGSVTRAAPAVQQRYGQGEQQDHQRHHDGESTTDIHVAGTEEAVAECIDHVQDGIDHRDLLRPLRQQLDGIEHTAEIRQR